MPLNPALRQETLNNPIQRGNPLNDPKYMEVQGYNNYDLNNGQMTTPRFGEATPITVFETVPGDRHFLKGNATAVLNQIDANLFSEVNMYQDYFYTPMRCVFPINYEKMIPNPTKGSDLPWKALPQIPLLRFLRLMLENTKTVTYQYMDADGAISEEYIESISLTDEFSEIPDYQQTVLLNQLIYVSYVLSRGSLLDYLGYSLDTLQTGFQATSNYSPYVNELQTAIDNFWNSLAVHDDQAGYCAHVVGTDLANTSLLSDTIIDGFSSIGRPDRIKVKYIPLSRQWSLSSFRAAVYDCIEKGLFIQIKVQNDEDLGLYNPINFDSAQSLLSVLQRILIFDGISNDVEYETGVGRIDPAEPFGPDFINPLRLAAYQLSVAEFMTNDSVDNVYTAELYMQNLRAVMFPSSNGVSKEPTFVYNGVDTEYDLLTTGAIEYSFFEDQIYGFYTRILPFVSLLFGMRRTLRYGDYFATGRPDLLAKVGQINVPATGGSVSPIDMNKSLVMQRFLNAVNWVGSKFVNYMTSIFGVKPSDTGCHPSFIAHRKVQLGRSSVTNVATEQGKVTTNLRGDTDDVALDVFIDEFGCIIGVESFDALPVYPSGIDRNFSNCDRYSMFNSMLQNVGDQDIKLYELTGVVADSRAEAPFAYSVRYSQYKFGITRAHGAFVNDLPGYCMLYPWHALSDDPASGDLKINPDFIRDKPFYFDRFFFIRSGMSPAQYYHFQVPVLNQHSAARKMQYQPPVL